MDVLWTMCASRVDSSELSRRSHDDDDDDDRVFSFI